MSRHKRGGLGLCSSRKILASVKTSSTAGIGVRLLVYLEKFPLKILKKLILLEKMKDFGREREGEALPGQVCAKSKEQGGHLCPHPGSGVLRRSAPVSRAPGSSSSPETGSGGYNSGISPGETGPARP